MEMHAAAVHVLVLLYQYEELFGSWQLCLVASSSMSPPLSAYQKLLSNSVSSTGTIIVRRVVFIAHDRLSCDGRRLSKSKA